MSTEESRRLFHQHIDEHSHQVKRWERKDPVLADTYTGHNLVAEVPGLAEYNAFNSGLRIAFPDLHINVRTRLQKAIVPLSAGPCAGRTAVP